MGFYEHHVFPRIVDLTLRGSRVARLRREALATAQTPVLEIGLGTGLNLDCYPRNIREITAIDLDPVPPSFVRARLERAAVRVELLSMDAARLGFAAQSFETVVTSWLLCSVPDPLAVLHEIRRVLRPGGQYLFLEHGRSPRPLIAAWQRIVEPVTRVCGCGCRPNRPIAELVSSAGFVLEELHEIDVPTLGRASGHVFRGRACPRS